LRFDELFMVSSSFLVLGFYRSRARVVAVWDNVIGRLLPLY